MSRQRGRIAGLSRAQVAALLHADGALGPVALDPRTAAVLERGGYLAPDVAGWSITARGRGAAAIVRGIHRGRAADNPGLSAKRARETPQVADAVCRLIRAVGRRAAREDLDGLESVLRLQAAVDAALEDAVRGLRRAPYTDGEIGEALGVSKQAVSKRWPWATGS